MERKFTGVWETGLAPDLLSGAAPISTWVYGSPEYVRRVFHLVETSRNFPHFKLGSKIHMRKSVMLASIWAQEERHWNERQKHLVLLYLQLNRALEALRKKTDSAGMLDDYSLTWIAETARLIEQLVRIDN